MADTKISALTAIGTLGNDDLFAVVDDPAGTPLSRKVTGDNLKTFTAVLDQYSADAVDRELTFNKSRNATNGSHTIVQNGDDLGTIRWQGSNGTTFDTAAFIIAEVDGTPGAATDMPGRLVFATTPDASVTPQERIRIDNLGRHMVGGGATITGCSGAATILQVVGATNSTNWPALSISMFDADAFGSFIDLNKSRNATPGSHTVVQAEDALGAINFGGSDGTNFETAAQIRALVDGTPGDNDMPGRLAFYTTPDASATPQERLRIDNAGRLIFTGGSGGGASREVQSGVTPDFQIYRNNIAAVMGFTAWFNNAVGPSLYFAHSKNDTSGTHTVLASGDEIGSIIFNASDGDEFLQSAKIDAQFDGTGGNGDVPGRLMFSTTADGGSSVTERLRIDQAGRIMSAQGAGMSNQFWEGAVNGHFQLMGTDGNFGNIMVGMFSNTDATCPRIMLGKSSNATVNTYSAVASGEALGAIDFLGSDGSANGMMGGARIAAFCDAATGTNDVAGRLSFQTCADGTVTYTEQLRINNAGRMIATLGQVAHFWVYWTANSTTILASHNVATIDDDNPGDAGINLTTGFSTNNYAAFVTMNDATGAWDATFTAGCGINVHTASVIDVLSSYMQDGTTAAAALTDPEQWQAVGFGVSA